MASCGLCPGRNPVEFFPSLTGAVDESQKDFFAIVAHKQDSEALTFEREDSSSLSDWVK